ncbi:SDR family NAD(P)-dependent oxidoreductase [Brevibacillus nitrificans]|uniref:SDR family NAD(P)-dependent oxidoreductase n=1 Tax=Brevibacillus nitrificans TaxID=651560 RepID=A0A3M8DKI3_9BACL|nr:SDR family NAD(P)-dependent oxidoreductase [Brevibacillus nitrificans]RNB88556.1 SDR family NAD(P)-dependent oxidoreductase [Brevibacillus nitrificans]
MQQPLETNYTARTTAEEVIKNSRLHGKVVIVTGGSAGLGLETAKSLAKGGATVIVPARNIRKAREALFEVENVVLYPAEFDLNKRDTVELFISWFQEHFHTLDILINCAGIMAIPYQTDSLGNELQISSNYLGHYYLTKGLLPSLKNTKGARVVNLSSRAHWFGPFNFDDPNFADTRYDKWIAYGHSKTAMSLMTVALDMLYQADGIRSFAVHPGSIVTNLSDSLTDEEMRAIGAITASGERRFTSYNDENKTIPEGAATIVWCAVSSDLDGYGGVYCENSDIAKVALDESNREGVRPWAIDEKLALKLWRETPVLFR